MPKNPTERLILFVFGGVALSILAVSIFQILGGLTSLNTWLEIIAIAVLAASVVGAYAFPIHVRHRVKVCMTSVPLYLLAVLVPSPFAVVGAALGTLVGNLIVRKQRDNLYSDVIVSASRLTLMVFVASLFAPSMIEDNLARGVVLMVVAVIMLVGDMISSSIQLSPIVNEPLTRLMTLYLREIAPVEFVQYMIGMLGALAAIQGLWALALLALPTFLAYLAFKSAKEMHDSTQQILEGMADTVDLRDPYTGGHSRRVSEISKHILREMHTVGPEVDLIVIAARVHDIGKLGIADQILFKPDSHTPDEAKIMRSHVERGADLLKRYPDFARGADIVRHHHERWDGKGYPDGLQGLGIPFGARVLMVADSFDAMTTDRPYRQGMSPEQALAVLRSGSEKQWDPVIVEALARVVLRDAQSLPLAKLSPSVAPS
jgi:HD-GYP domain-containing protein (c-di-GMP phosphodiesterase class II)